MCRNPTKDSCTQKKHTCDPLSPYVGIIQIRFWVKAAAYSQPVCASTPFLLIQLYQYCCIYLVIHITCVMINCFQQQFYYTRTPMKCKFFYPCICKYFSFVASPPRIWRSDLLTSSTFRVSAARDALIFSRRSVTSLCTVDFEIPKCFAACLTVVLLSMIYLAISIALSSI